MKVPANLKKGDLVGIVSPSRQIVPAEIEKAIEIIESWGLKTVIGKYSFAGHNQFAGSDEQRAQDFQEMLDNREIKAIFCSRGGYGSVRIIDKLDFSQFINWPKWIAGFSDITVFHSHINKNFGLPTLHCEMPLNFGKPETHPSTLESIKKILMGEKLEYFENTKNCFVEGSTFGELTGGNLSVLYSLIGSISDIDTTGKILFLEDLDEYLYHVDRMIIAFKRAGKLSKINGLIIGGMTDMKDNKVPFGKTAEEIIFEQVKDLGIPVVCGFPTGHLFRNLALKMGANAVFKVKGGKYSLAYTD